MKAEKNRDQWSGVSNRAHKYELQSNTIYLKIVNLKTVSGLHVYFRTLKTRHINQALNIFESSRLRQSSKASLSFVNFVNSMQRITCINSVFMPPPPPPPPPSLGSQNSKVTFCFIR